MSQEIIFNLGIWTIFIGGCILLILIQTVLLVAIAFLGKRIWQRVTRTYALHVVSYWLRRLELEGTHTFEKARQEAEQARNP